MTVMDVEATTSSSIDEEMLEETTEIGKIIDCLTNDTMVCFKSQQRGETDLTKQEKSKIAFDLYNSSKLNFLVKFGKHLDSEQLNYFQQFTTNFEDSSEINVILKDLIITKNNQQIIKNRRYEALKQMILEDSYFSEIEMMKRNPLLYEQLIGQFLTVEEIRERDKIELSEQSSFVKILMEGIERDDAKIKQREEEDNEEEDSDDDREDQPTYSQWGEFHDKKERKRKHKTKQITTEEQKLLKEEFITSMYQNFLDGKDDDFDYSQVDNNDKLDNNDIMDHDEEDKYFDSEEPELVVEDENVESEDEFDIFMSALNQNTAVNQLSNDLNKL